MLVTGSIVGTVVLVALVLVFLRLRKDDLIGELIAKRKATSRIVNRAQYMEGMEKMPVALALGSDAVYYENEDLQASLELAHVEEVEYDEETATGHSVEGRVLRLRSHGHSFEFLLDEATARLWQPLLPARHLDEQAAS